MIKIQKQPFNDTSALFQAVQTSEVFADSKTFVDCVPRTSWQEVEALYQSQKENTAFNLVAFVYDNFDLPKQYASDFQSDTSRLVSEHIKLLWNVLTRQADDVSAESSLIPLPHPYIVPGGRFGEVYYWDSYFTMLGLQAHGRTDLMQSMIQNFAYLLNTYGLIPNGNRTYYLGRSQPPFFSLMVSLLPTTLGERWGHALAQEYAFWMDGQETLDRNNSTHRRVVRLPDGTILNRFWDDFDRPRPESYREDVAIAQQSDLPAEITYRHLRAGAESGWDFCSRWFKDEAHIHSIHTTDILPVDLNCLLWHLENSLLKIYKAQGNNELVEKVEKIVQQRLSAIQTYCWDQNRGFYFDYDFVAGTRKNVYSLAAVYPLFFGIATPEQAQQVAEVLEKQFLKSGGLVATLTHTHEQWDAPNGWAPLHWLAIEALRRYGINDLADEIANRWVQTNVTGYHNTGKLVEKYNVEAQTAGGGGEYPTQDGFGWTNGVLAKLLHR